MTWRMVQKGSAWVLKFVSHPVCNLNLKICKKNLKSSRLLPKYLGFSGRGPDSKPPIERLSAFTECFVFVNQTVARRTAVHAQFYEDEQLRSISTFPSRSPNKQSDRQTDRNTVFRLSREFRAGPVRAIIKVTDDS